MRPSGDRRVGESLSCEMGCFTRGSLEHCSSGSHYHWVVCRQNPGRDALDHHKNNEAGCTVEASTTLTWCGVAWYSIAHGSHHRQTATFNTLATTNVVLGRKFKYNTCRFQLAQQGSRRYKVHMKRFSPYTCTQGQHEFNI